MASIQNTFTYENTSGQTEFEQVTIEVVLPKFSFRLSDQEIKRYISGNEIFKTTHRLQTNNYKVNLPLNKLVETDIKDIYGFFLYHFIEVINVEKNINDFSFQFTVNLKDEQGQEFASEVFEGIYYQKEASSSDYDLRNYRKEFLNFEQTYGPLDNLNAKGLAKLPKTKDKNVFIINKQAYELFKYIFSTINSDQVPVSDVFVLDFIQILTDLSDKLPKLITTKAVISYTQLADFFKNKGYNISKELYDYVITNFAKLFDFPLSLPDIQPLHILGTVEIITEKELTMSDLDFYDFTVEYSQNNGTPKILRYNWSEYDDNIVANKINFGFGQNETILAHSITEYITVKIKSYEGAILWEKKYSSNDNELRNLEIVINEYQPGKNTIDSSTGKPKSIKRIRGKVLQNADKYKLDGLTIIIQAKKEGDDLFRIASATKTDKSGNFSLDYPYGDYLEAQALVSLMPNSPVDLAINEETPNETISDDFIYLLLTDAHVIENEEVENPEDDCDCHTPKNKAKRLPDQADLIESDEYTQDIGGTCLNLSTPNRTLKEYSYNAIVRISDPDISNYILQKKISNDKIQYDLVRQGGKVSRNVVDLDNPILWEDAPDAKENLSLYQAVTVATGHILYYKSVFKADGYSLGDLVYSLPLAPGQKKQIVVFETSHSLIGAESQSLSQAESLSAGLLSDRFITDEITAGIGENLSGKSKAHTSGMSAGLGASASYGGIGASLGIAGGFSNSNSSATQNSSRNISQFFGEKLRQSLMQNAESYRELNASVVTTVTEDQNYGVTTEVVANHNHCHSLTMMYFEVLRHYAIYQEIAHVEECVFVPLLMTHFTTENIHKWKDVIAPKLRPIPSNTYLQPFSYFLKRKQHPLLKAFDANERIKTNYTKVEFPPENTTYADGTINQITGSFTMNVDIPRPKSKYDRIKSLPKPFPRSEVDPMKTAKKGFFDGFLAVMSGGLSTLVTGPPGSDVQYTGIAEEVLVKEALADEFITIDANFQSVPPNKTIRVKTFQPRSISLNILSHRFDMEYTGEEFFEDGIIDKKLWTTYAKILGYGSGNGVYDMLDYYFAGRLIYEWDEIFYQDLLPLVFAKIVDTLELHWGSITVTTVGGVERLRHSGDGFNLDFSTNSKYTGGDKKIVVNFNSTGIVGKIRSELPMYLSVSTSNTNALELKNHVKLNLGKVSIDYTTDFFTGSLYRGYVNDDLLDGSNLYIPQNSRDKTDPRREDEYLVNELIEHLNSNIEYYNKLLWRNLDPDRRYMLLDGFNIQTYTSSGHKSVMRSLASVVKNELITITGNSLVFPVSDGFRVGRDSILEEIGDGVVQEISLLDHYKPLTPVPPYRISVPTRGVFMEAVQGSCDACEMVKENSSQDWDKFRTDEPTSIATVITPTPTVTDYKPQYKDFAQPLVNIQNAPDAPAPAAGLSQLSELLGKAGVFNDITGLAGNQDNVIRTYLSNQENAKAFAEMSKSLATQQHNTTNRDGISEDITRARRAGTITDEDAQALTRQHLQQQIDGGESLRETAQFDRESSRPSLAEVAAAAASSGRSVQAERTDSDGTHESIEVSGERNEGTISVMHNIDPIQQPSSMSCWATAATMMINWKNGRSSRIDDVLIDAGNNLNPPDENYYLNMYNANIGLQANEKDRFISSLNMVGSEPANYPLSQYIEWLRNYGPIWVTTDANEGEDFSPHARILYGIEESQLHFVNPANGNQEQQSFTEFINDFEQMVIDNPARNPLFIQVVRFTERILTTAEGGGDARELYRNTTIGRRLISGDAIQGHTVNVGTNSVRVGGINYRLRNGSQWGIIYGGRNIAIFRDALNDLAATYRAEGNMDSDFKALATLGFELVSEHEGKVTAINTWDSMDFTWGAGFADARLNNFLRFLPNTGDLANLLNQVPWLRGNRFNRELFRRGPEHLNLDNFHLLTQSIETNNTFFSQLTSAQARQFVENEVMANANTPARQTMMNFIGSNTVAPVVGIAGYLNHGRPAYAGIPVEMINAAIIEVGDNYTKQVTALFRIYIQTVNRAALRLNREDRLELIYNTLATRVPNKIKVFNQGMRNNGFPDYEFSFAEANEVLPCINPEFNMTLLDGPDGVRISPLLMWLHNDSEYSSPNISMNYDTTNPSVRRYRGYYNLGASLSVPEP
ncbi:papain-like cysteine protease family protein [Cellulophaga sp. Hel_I_12]|uniref:papain-like cysteine protease family protein n=1 Tax=Cellulophaga sp. Hel_I_12 TaxID=1249972 RepID=UPI00064768FC|nr:papain-like cysteine protease family protein [Cellulophaga sp. Hel_I_12]